MGVVSFELHLNVRHPRFGDAWHLADGGTLPSRVWFKIARGRDGQWVCSEVDIDSPQPITTTTLRNIPMSRIIDKLMGMQLEYFDRGGMLDLATGLREFYDGGPIAGLTAEEIRAGAATADMPPEEVDEMYRGNGRITWPQERVKRGGPPPQRDLLERFADAYRRALQTDRRHAIAKTMQILKAQTPPLGISRATANRWRDACRRADPPLLDPQ